MEIRQLEISPTVLDALKNLGSGPVCAADFVRAILRLYGHDKEYAGGIFISLTLNDTPQKKTPDKWLGLVQSLFDAESIMAILGSKERAMMHGRLVIIGLGLLEPELYDQLKTGNAFNKLVSELHYPIEKVLTEEGRKLFDPKGRARKPAETKTPETLPVDSVPTISDDPLSDLKQDLLGRAAFARFLARRISNIPREDTGAYAIHLYGPWGAGKSSLLNFLCSELTTEHLYLFSIDAKYEGVLNSGQLSSELREDFRKNGETLSGRTSLRSPPKEKLRNANLSENTSAQSKQNLWNWEIVNIPECYLLKKMSQEDGGKIDVFTKKQRWLKVDFNAWQNQHIDPPWWSLLDAIYRGTQGKLSPLNRISEWWWRLTSGRVLSIFSAVVLMWVLVLGFGWVQQNIIQPQVGAGKPVSETTGAIAKLVKDLGEIIAFVGTIWSGILVINRSLLLGSAGAAATYKERIQDPMNEIKKRFNRLIERLAPQRVVVFIDDLDRCQSKYAIELLEGIQTLFRERPVVYVVAADRRWLNACYEEVYEKLKPNIKEPGKPLGTLFLEKAFRFSTPMPGLSKELREEFWQHILQLKASGQSVDWEKERRGARVLVDKASNEAEVRKLTVNDAKRTPAAQRAVIEEAVVRLSAPEIMERLEHTLTPYSELLEPNPRAMKRLVNAYSANRALAFLARLDIEQHQLALWTILNSRWPQLADYLGEHPEMVEKIGQEDLNAVREDLRDLFREEDVKRVVKGGSMKKRLYVKTLQKCGGVRA